MRDGLVFPADITTLSIAGSDERFPVRRVYCVGRNYAAHAKEMGVTDRPDAPMFFSKPATAVVDASQPTQIAYPTATQELHHEVEWVVALGRGAPQGRAISHDEAQDLVFGHAVGLDLTRRDLQTQAKQKGHPWDVAKGFDQSAPVSAIVPMDEWPTAESTLRLSVNDDVRQQATLGDMLFDVPSVLVHLSALFWLRAGDLIFTGTPSGVSAIRRGDVLQANLGTLASMRVTVA